MKIFLMMACSGFLGLWTCLHSFGGEDETIQLLRLESPKKKLAARFGSALRFSHNNDYLVAYIVAKPEPVIYVWDMKQSRLLDVIEPEALPSPLKNASPCVFHENGSTLFFLTNASIQGYDLTKRKILTEIKHEEPLGKTLNYALDYNDGMLTTFSGSSKLFAESRNKTVPFRIQAFWRRILEHPIDLLETDGSPMISYAHHDSTRETQLVGFVNFKHFSSRTKTLQMASRIISATQSSDGAFIVFGDDAGLIYIWDLATNEFDKIQLPSERLVVSIGILETQRKILVPVRNEKQNRDDLALIDMKTKSIDRIFPLNKGLISAMRANNQDSLLAILYEDSSLETIRIEDLFRKK